MATITSTDIEVYLGASGAGAKVGNTITKQGSPATVNLNLTELGVNLSQGRQYSVKARCTNSDSVTSDWTAFYNFKTLIYAELINLVSAPAGFDARGDLTYTQGEISVDSCGIYYSTNASGANAVKYTTTPYQGDGGETEFEDQSGMEIRGLLENTRYYVVPWVRDSLNREYVGDWLNDAESVITGYAAPTVVISNLATTTNTISGNVSISTNDTLSSAEIRLKETGGNTWYYINLNATTGLQTFSISDGDTDKNGNTISIQPSTEYIIQIYATNSTSGGTGSAVATATTAQAVPSTLAITGVDNITPTSAVVNIAYGSGV